MLRGLKLLLGLVLVLGATAVGWGFALIGPAEVWQVPRVGHNLGGDIGGPKLPYEGYRWNLPVITYAFDTSFIYYFGDRGMAEVEKAIKILNDLPPFSSITNDRTSLYINGNPVPTDTRRKNYEAEALGLLDLKSFTLAGLLEQLGLDSPERWAWALRNRFTYTVGNQTYTNYFTVNYNFDPINFKPTPYVNGVLYYYDIVEGNNISDAEEWPVDPLAIFPFSSVAGFNLTGGGDFFTGLTHDDVGGLRWLYSRDRVFNETISSNLVLVATNFGGSPWMPWFTGTNFVGGTNFVSTNVLAGLSNLLVNQALRPGINKLQLRRVNYDSLLGQTFVPITNQFTDTYISNGTFIVQRVERVLNRPDIVFTVDDLGVFTDDGFPVIYRRTDTSGWANNDVINGQDTAVDAGPGVIQPPILLSFSNKLPYFVNETPSFFVGTTSLFLGGAGGIQDLGTRLTAAQSVIWGSYDGTTNAIVVYPRYGNITVDDLRQFEVQGEGDNRSGHLY